jgi:putative intracellular protease/amidase
VAKTRDLVPSEGAAKGGFTVKPHQTFDEVGDGLDLLLVPGGLTGTLAALADEATLRFLRERGGKAKLVGSVCTGSLLLGAAGLLRGRRATSHWQLLEVLEAAGAKPVAERVVFDGTDRVTAAGVSAGLDLGFELIRRFRGDFYAKGMQLLGEYDPQPPFAGGGNPRRQGPPGLEMGPVRWPSSRCEEVCWVRWFMESRQFLSELHTDHEPGRAGRARSPSAPMRNTAPSERSPYRENANGSWRAASSFQNCTRTMNQDGLGRARSPSAPMRKHGALGEVALPRKFQRFMAMGKSW